MNAIANPIAALAARGQSLAEYFRPRFLWLTAFFCACLIPVVIDGASSNYLFILYPLPALLFTGKLKMPHENLLFAITIYTAIFAIGMLYQYEYAEAIYRRIASFILFMGIFAFVFVDIDEEMKVAFKLSVVIMGCYFTLYAMWKFFQLGGSALGSTAKDLVGSQRYGFVYLLAFWVLYLSRPGKIWLRYLRLGVMFIPLIGLGLTFSRASIVSLAFSYAAFFLWSLRIGQGNSIGRVLKSIFFIALGVTVAVVLVSIYFPVLFEFFNQRLLTLFFSGNNLQNHLSDSATSEGERIFIWTNIVNFVLRNPLTGGGFLGFWILDIFGSSHNQYFDTLFRTGFVGLAIYLLFLLKIGLYLWRSDRVLLWPFLGILLYGMFHETFKESQGGFMLAFLMGMAWQVRPTFDAFPTMRFYGAAAVGSEFPRLTQ